MKKKTCMNCKNNFGYRRNLKAGQVLCRKTGEPVGVYKRACSMFQDVVKVGTEDFPIVFTGEVEGELIDSYDIVPYKIKVRGDKIDSTDRSIEVVIGNNNFYFEEKEAVRMAQNILAFFKGEEIVNPSGEEIIDF